jgi:hypothetical protein
MRIDLTRADGTLIAECHIEDDEWPDFVAALASGTWGVEPVRQLVGMARIRVRPLGEWAGDGNTGRRPR